MKYIKDIRIVVGVHDNPSTNQGPRDLPEEKLHALVNEIADVVRKYTSQDSYVEAVYESRYRSKIDS
jgi:hypothetical protein